MIIDDAHYRRMERSYQPELARFLSLSAGRKELITYGAIAEKFGGIARGYGDRLGGITIFCRDNALPLLPVVVVNKRTRRPSDGAQLYFDFGIKSDEAMGLELARCFAFDWTTVQF